MRVRVVAAFIVVVAAFFAGGWLLRRGMTNVARPETTVRTAEEGTKLFNSVVETVRNYAVDSLDDSRIYQLATSGVLGELTDPYAALIPAADTLRPRTVLGPDAVQGMYLDWSDGLVTVVAVVPGSPAARAGARAGDAILRIGNTTLGHQTPEEAARLLGGADGSTVRVRVGREAGTPALWLSLVRGPAVAPPAPSVETLDGDLAMVRAFTVDSQAAASLRSALDGLGQRGGRGLVLDLRGAVGGTLDGVVAMGDALLGRDQSVVVAVGRGPGDSTVVTTRGVASQPDLAVVVLVDQGTAGPAEALAGALQDHDRAVVIGATTFGRAGAVSYYPVGNGLALRLLTELWRTPSGRTIQRLPPVEDGSSAPADTVETRPTFTTDGGRTVFGGGGIVPDRLIPLGPEGSGADDALAVARDLLLKHPNRRALVAAIAKTSS